MKTIHQLSEIVTAKIAAGEVIERPAFAVKELVENALDAGATRIEIHLEESGLKKIIVYDNGSGMSKEDIAECFKPHTTSKIPIDGDLVGIRSLGFRGEALSSIASISALRIQSRISTDTVGTMIELSQGDLEKISSVGMPVGTHITVEQLFSGVPVRKKFLKSERTELRHSIDIVGTLALAYPHISFLLLHNRKPIFELSKQTLRERIEAIFGEAVPEQLIVVEHEDSYIHIAGFISHPQLSYPSSAKNYIFINGRAIADQLLTTAIKDAYGTLLESNQYPFSVLSLTLPPEVVDVNVHPRKEYVNFVDRRFIFDAVQRAIAETLARHNITFNVHISPTGTTSLKPKQHKKLTKSFAGQLLKQQVIPAAQTMLKIKPEDILQLHNLYLVVPSSEGYLIIDQHAAHERILYEQFSLAFAKEKMKEFKLDEPILVDFSASDLQTFEEHREFFISLGFEVEPFHTSIKVTKVPEVFKDRNIRDIIFETLSDLQSEKDTKSLDTKTHKMLTYLACRSAVKAGDKIVQEKAFEIISELEKCQQPNTCPHGRPTKINVSLSELNKLFKRS